MSVKCSFRGLKANDMDQHMRRMRELHAARLDALIRCGPRHLGGVMELVPTRDWGRHCGN
jgi:hypothetical protein